jgi:hypothetical protein
MNAGEYWTPTGMMTGDTTSLVSSNTEYCCRFDNGLATRLDRIGLEITVVAGAASSVYLSLRGDYQGRPYNLINTYGFIDGNLLGYQELVINQSIVPRTVYWLSAITIGAAPSVRMRTLDPIVTQLAFTGSANRGGYSDNGSGIPLPTIMAIDSVVAGVPKVLVRSA